MLLFFDTETTGKFDFRLPVTDARQPRLVQLAALATDAAGNELGRVNTLIRPDGWTIPAEATAVHGFTAEQCDLEGVPLAEAIDRLADLAARCKTAVAHNIEFDLGILAGESARAGVQNPLDRLGRYCTKDRSTDAVKLPGRYGSYKWPTLAEAYRHFYGRELADAHDAMGDVIGCRDVYFALNPPAAAA